MVKSMTGLGLAGIVAAAGLGSGAGCFTSSSGGESGSSSGGGGSSSGASSSGGSSSGSSGGSSSGSSGSSSGANDGASEGSSASDAGGDAGNFDSCSVVTQAEASSAIGETVTAGVLGNATVEGGLACVFYGPSSPTPHDPNVAQTDSVRVVVVEGPDALTWYENYKSMVSPQAISGYGDQAYYDGYASLSVMKGDYYLRVDVEPADSAPSLTDEEQLAAAILPSL